MDNIELLAKARSYGNMSDEDFDREALNNGFSPEEIEASKTYMPQPTMQQVPQEPIAQQPAMQQPTMQQEPQASVRPSIDELKQTYRGKVDLRKQKDFLKEQGYSDEELKKLDDTFEVMDDQMFENFVTDLANGKSLQDIAMDLTKFYAQGATTQEDIEAAATEAGRLIQNFEITRMLKNSANVKAYEPYFKKLYPNLSKKDLETIKSTDLAPSFWEAISDWDALGVGLEQDWLGAKQTLAQLGMGTFTAEDEKRKQELSLEERKNEIRTNAMLGLDLSDFSPSEIALFLLDPTKGASKIYKALKAAGAGALAYSHTKGQGGGNIEAGTTAALAATLPFLFKGVAELYPKAEKLIGKIKSSDTKMAKDLENELQNVSPEVLEKTIDFADKYGYNVNIGSIVPEHSDTYLIARTAKTYSTILGSIGDVFSANAKALDEATKQTLKELHNNPVTAKLVKQYDMFGNESQLVQDPITELIKTNLAEVQTDLADKIRKTYKDFSQIAKEFPAQTSSTPLVDELLMYRDKTNLTLEDTLADKFKNKLDEMIIKNFENKVTPPTLNDLEELSKSVGKLAQSSKDPEILAIKIQFRDYLTDLKLSKLQSIEDYLVSKEARTPIEEALLEKIPQALDIQLKAKELYKTKRAYFVDKKDKDGNPSKAYIGKFVQSRGAEVMSKLLASANLEELTHLKSAFNVIGKGDDFKQIGARMIIDEIGQAFNATTNKYTNAELSNRLEDILNDSNRMELFGFDSGAVESLQYLYRISKAQQNFSKLINRELQTTNQQISVLARMMNNVWDTIRGWFAIKSLPSNAKIKEFANQIKHKQAKIEDSLKADENREALRALQKLGLFRRSATLGTINTVEGMFPNPTPTEGN